MYANDVHAVAQFANSATGANQLVLGTEISPIHVETMSIGPLVPSTLVVLRDYVVPLESAHH